MSEELPHAPKVPLHSDSWTGTAAELAGCKMLAIHPVTGWWKELKRQEAWDRKARYSLIVSIESEKSDIYTLIRNEVEIGIEV